MFQLSKAQREKETMMRIKGSKHIWWIGAATLTGGLCVMNACGDNTGNETVEGEQLVFSSVKDLDKVKERIESCVKKGRRTTCWNIGNSCTWYPKIIGNNTDKLEGSCYLDCSDLIAGLCKPSIAWHCKFNTEKNKCVRDDQTNVIANNIDEAKKMIECISYKNGDSCNSAGYCTLREDIQRCDYKEENFFPDTTNTLVSKCINANDPESIPNSKSACKKISHCMWNDTENICNPQDDEISDITENDVDFVE